MHGFYCKGRLFHNCIANDAERGRNCVGVAWAGFSSNWVVMRRDANMA